MVLCIYNLYGLYQKHDKDFYIYAHTLKQLRMEGHSRLLEISENLLLCWRLLSYIYVLDTAKLS